MLSPQPEGFVAAVSDCADDPPPIPHCNASFTPFNNALDASTISSSPPHDNLVRDTAAALTASLSVSGNSGNPAYSTCLITRSLPRVIVTRA